MTRISEPQIIWAPTIGHFYSDCACPVDTIQLPSSPLPAAALWQETPGLYQASLQDGHYLTFNPLGAAGVVVLNESANRLLHHYWKPRALLSEHAQTMATLQLLQPADAPAPVCLSKPNSLMAWLHLTNACNLNCSYCYINKSNESMDEDTGRAAVTMLFQEAQKYGYQSVKLKYAGGEPTLNFGLLQRLHRYAQTLSQDSGIALESVMLSNGVRLTTEMLDFLYKHDIGLSLSLDGLGVSHDAQRTFLGGQPTSWLVQKSIAAALAHGVKPHLSITITQKNAVDVAEVAAFALKRGLFFNLNFYREPTPGANGQQRAANAKLIDAVMQTLAVIEANLPTYNLFATLIDRTNFAAPHTRTCGVGDNYMVIDHHGRLARCHMDIGHPLGTIWEDDPLLTLRRVSASSENFINAPVDVKEECSTCRWRYWCAGGCPLTAYNTSGRATAKSPYCEVYKTIFPELLRLEGMRLLKWQGS